MPQPGIILRVFISCNSNNSVKHGHVDIFMLEMRKRRCTGQVGVPQVIQRVAELEFHLRLTPKVYSLSNLLCSLGKNTTYFRNYL